MTTDGTLTPSGNELEQLRREVELLRAQRDQLLASQQQSDRTIEGLQRLLRRMYGRSSEKIDPRQMALFEKLLEQLSQSQSPAPEPATASTATETPASPEAPKSAGHGRRRLPPDLPRQKVIHDLPEEEKPCPCCGKLRHVIGQEVSEQLDYVPAKLTVIEHVRLKYACRACEQSAVESGLGGDHRLSPPKSHCRRLRRGSPRRGCWLT